MVHTDPTRFMRRMAGIVLASILILFFIGEKLVAYHIADAAVLRAESYERRAMTNTIPAIRGEIVDKNGDVLARTVDRYDVNVDPNRAGDIYRRDDAGNRVLVTQAELVNEIAAVLELDPQEISAKLQDDSQYANLAKRVDAAVYSRLRQLEIPWLYFDSFVDRLYPNGAVAGNLIGFVGSDGTPLEGLERQYNSCLAGVDGQETYERSTDGVRIPSSNVVTQPAEQGGRLHLTLDANLQFFGQQVISEAVANNNADWGQAIVMDVKTGEILVAAEAPSVDPNNPGGVDVADRSSRIFRTAIEPGSTMKVLTASMLIDSGIADETSTIQAPDEIELPWGDTIEDSFKHDTYLLGLAGVLVISSNTAISSWGVQIPRADRYDYLRKFGFGEVSSVRFPGESSGILRDAGDWDELTNYTTTFGQGVSVTMIQMASAYQALANGGVRLDPSLVSGCEKSDGTFVNSPVPKSHRVLSESAANLTVEMMEKVVEQGSIGKMAAVEGYRVGGKTGTAQIARASGGYESRYAISFFGVAPAENPRYVVGVTLYRPAGAVNSLPTAKPFKIIMQQVLKNFRVPPSVEKSRDILTRVN